VGGTGLLRRSVGMVVSFSCLFYTLFLFDTLGDAEGLSGAYWVLIVVPLLVIAGALCVALLKRLHPPYEAMLAGSEKPVTLETELPTLSPMAAAVSGDV
jgi:hypothetical protein